MISVRGAILSSCVIYIKEENKKIGFERPRGFYSNGNNECNRNELGRQLVYQLDAL